MSTRCHVATRKGLFTLERGSSGWNVEQVSFLGDNCTLVTHDPRTGNLFAALDHGHFGVKLHRSEDGGATWTAIAAPRYPEKPADYQPKVPVEGRPAEWSLKLIWAIEPGGADEPGVLWCGTLPGGLFKSTDDGASWELNRPLWDDPRREEWFGGGFDVPGIHSVLVDPRDSKHLTVGVSCGGVWITRDGGETWDLCGKGLRAEFLPPEKAYEINTQDPHMVVHCPSDPDKMWTQHHNGIFRTTDAAASWTEMENVEPSAFGFAVAVHPDNADKAWFVPAVKDEKRYPCDGKVVVTRTSDGGRSFDVLRNGLPQDHAYDVVLRHALDIDESGDRLAFGSTTGNVWFTENGGDEWRAISSHLPPVYAVRFEKPRA